MNRNLYIAFTVAFLFGLFHQGYLLECYQCSAPREGNCDRPKNLTNGNEKIPCPENHTVCFVQNDRAITPDIITRGCGLSAVCDYVNPSSNITCKTCDKNLCNTNVVEQDGKIGPPDSSPSLRPLNVFLVFNLIFVFVFACKY